MKIDKSLLHYRKCSEGDIRDIMLLQSRTFSVLDNSDLLRYNPPEMFKKCLYSPHYTLGVEYNEKLIAFGILYDGELTNENLAKEMDLSNEELLQCINIKLIIVDDLYWGNKLQNELIRKLEKIALDNNYKRACATVSPENHYSINNFLEMEYIFYKRLIKYDNLKRNLYYKILA